MANNVTTELMEQALTKLAEEMGLSIKEYVELALTTRPPNVEPANQKFKDTLGIKN
jgi:hypothetical protein